MVNLKKIVKCMSLVLFGLSLVVLFLTIILQNSYGLKGSKNPGKSKKVIIQVATNASPKPFNYDKDGELTGYETEVVREIFRGLDQYELNFNIVEWPAIFSGLDGDRFQLAVNNISYTDERADRYLYSLPILKHPSAIIIPKNSDIKGLEDIGGKSTEVVQGTTTAAQLEKYNAEHVDNPTNINYTKASIQTILNELNDGKYDYKLFERVIAETLISDQGLDNLKVIELLSDQQPHTYILFAAGQEDLRDKVNERIKALHINGTLEKLSQEFLGGSYLP